MDKKKRWNIIKLLLKLGFTTLLCYLVFTKIDLRQVKSIFLKSDYRYILAAFFIYYLSQVISSSRLIGFLRGAGINPSFGSNFRLYMLGMFYNVFLPGGIGGDGFKIFLLRKKYTEPTRKIFLAILLDRVSGVWAILTLATILSFFLPPGLLKPGWAVACFLFITICYFGVLRFVFPGYPKNYIATFTKAILVQSLQLVSIMLILRSQSFDGNYAPYLFSFLASSLATVIPVSIGGLGIREYVMMQASLLFNMDQNLAIFSTLTFYVLSSLAALPGAWFAYHSKQFYREEKYETAVDNANQSTR